MSVDIEAIAKNLEEEIGAVSNSASLEALRIKYVGRKGILSEILSHLADLPSEQRPVVGKHANALKQRLLAFIKEKATEFNSRLQPGAKFDITLPGTAYEIGQRHPLTRIM